MTQETRLRVTSNPTRGWQANKKTHLCVASGIRAMPETEKPPAMRVDIYYDLLRNSLKAVGVVEKNILLFYNDGNVKEGE